MRAPVEAHPCRRREGHGPERVRVRVPADEAEEDYARRHREVVRVRAFLPGRRHARDRGRVPGLLAHAVGLAHGEHRVAIESVLAGRVRRAVLAVFPRAAHDFGDRTRPLLENGGDVHRSEAPRRDRAVRERGFVRHRRLRGASGRQGSLRHGVRKDATVGRRPHQGCAARPRRRRRRREAVPRRHDRSRPPRRRRHLHRRRGRIREDVVVRERERRRARGGQHRRARRTDRGAFDHEGERRPGQRQERRHDPAGPLAGAGRGRRARARGAHGDGRAEHERAARELPRGRDHGFRGVYHERSRG